MTEWPEDPPLRFLVYWGLRRKELCDPRLCDKAEGDEPCAECPLRRLEEAQLTAKGSLLRRANDLRAILALGVTISIDDLDADELSAMLIIESELDRLDKERKRD